MELEEWESMEYCRKCRDYHLVTEDMGTWFCGGERPTLMGGTELEGAKERMLDRMLKDPELAKLLGQGK